MGTRQGQYGLLLGLASLVGSGCSSGPGQPLGFLSQSHPLTPQAIAQLNAHPEPAPLPRELSKSLLPPYVVEPGDVLLVTPAELDSPVRLPGDQTVLQDGTIDLGRFGRPVVAGKTVPQIEQEVRQLIQDQQKDAGTIGVRLISRVSKVFYVLGEVNAPGAFPLSGRETVLDALMVAGGLTRRATTGRLLLSRPTPPDGCRIVLPVCYSDIVQVGDTATNYQILPGDRIFVPSKTFLEDLCPSKSICAPCGRPQTPCPVGGGCQPDAPTLPH